MNLPTKILLVYYLILNLVLFFMMGYDKMRAKKEQWRVPESTLFIAALLGSAIGGFAGMSVFHHKNRKPQFYIIFGISIVLHIALLYFLYSTVLTIK